MIESPTPVIHDPFLTLISDISIQSGVCSYINTAGDMKASWSHQAIAAVPGCHSYTTVVKKEMAQREVIPMKDGKLNKKTVITNQPCDLCKVT